jgi:hypothetical protein
MCAIVVCWRGVIAVYCRGANVKGEMVAVVVPSVEGMWCDTRIQMSWLASCHDRSLGTAAR